jgi:hypothetical protein
MESTVPTAWNEPQEQPETVTMTTAYKDHSMSFLTKLLIASALFCAIALSLGAFLFFRGANLISADNIAIDISGPVSIPGGEEVSFDLRVTNKNNVDLQLADLEVNFPEGSTKADNPSEEIRVYRELLGDIPAGSTVQKTIKAIIFGEENMQKQIDFGVTYKVKGSTSLFTKNKSYDILINSSPIVMKTSSFSEITSGQEFDITVNLKSNSAQTLKNVLLKGQYPFGFTYMSSNIPPLAGNTTWKIGDIPPGGERKVVIHGNLKGENADTRVFRFSVGVQSANDPKSIGAQYMAAEQHIAIAKPFISTTISIDNDEGNGDFPLSPGENKRVKISWYNNLPTAVSNVEISADLSGNAYDRSGVTADGGYYKSSENQIIWNQQTNPELASVGAGESGSVTFSLKPKDTRTVVTPILNPSVSIVANISGNRVGDVSGTITSAATRNLKVSSAVTLSGRVVRTVGPFSNSGPIPPKVDQSSTYTIIWDIDNTSSPVTNAVVSAKLPPNVKWTGQTNPSFEDIDYDANTSMVTWKAGTIGTYTRQASKTKEVFFQVSIEPNLPQAGSVPALIGAATLTASDDFSGLKLSDNQDSLTTRFSSDPGFKAGQEIVVK